MSPEQISAWVAPVATRWRKHRDLAAVSMAAMRGIEAKALRLGHTSEQLLASGGDAIADLALALAKGRIASGAAAPGAPVFILAGSGAESALALEAGLRIAASDTPIVVALCGTRARPEHAAASAAWDRLESLTNARSGALPRRH
jgi:NAD(P)H-hydrate repair Nnr-like enzyme with NAD(P)H-hydrate epimerase domain